jgi:phosphoribosylamine---glycine ligase
MKILLIDAIASYVDFALRCQAAGHEVRVFMGPDPKGLRHPAGDGLVKKVTNWQAHMKWADLICTSDNTKYVKELEGYRKEGYLIWGCNVDCATWELQRDVGVEVFERAGIKTIPSILFKNYDDAIAHLDKNPEVRYVSKPLGDADRALSYVSKSSRDLRFMLTEWKKHAPKHPFIFQEFHGGIEVAVGAWVGRNGFGKYCLENFEHKKLMNDDIGPNTGEMGTVMKYVPIAESLLAQKLLLPLEAELIRQGYTGYIDVAVIIDKKGVCWPLEFTTRPGWPLFQIQQVLHREPVQWMLDACNGTDSFEPYDDVAVGLVCAIKDFPYNFMPREAMCGFPMWGLTEKNRYFFHPAEMQLGEAPELDGGKLVQIPMMVSAGSYMGVVSGVGKGVEAAVEHAYENLKQLEFANSPMYRTDIGKRVTKQLPELQKMGYMTNWRL